MSHCRQQGFIEAPVERVWELIADVEHHPRVVAESARGPSARTSRKGATYRQLTQTPDR